jgi:tight adherence protein C
VIGVGYFGFKLPDIWLKNEVQKRQTSIRIAFPDALDLLLICVESGMPIEQAFKRVSEEIGVQSIPLAEELAVTTAELSYLPNRRTPYETLRNARALTRCATSRPFSFRRRATARRWAQRCASSRRKAATRA